LYPEGREKEVTYASVLSNPDGSYKTPVLRMPAEPGRYVVRWESSKREVYAEASISVQHAEVDISFPEEVPAGTEFTVSLEAPEGLEGYVYLYPSGSDKSVTYASVRSDAYGKYQPVRLRIPSQEGEYVVRWETSKREMLAEGKIKGIMAEASMSHSEEVIIGTELSVTLNAPEGLGGYVYLYAAGRDRSITYASVRDANTGGYQPVAIRMPSTPGEYDLKWVNSYKEVISQTSVRVVAAEIALQCPAETEAGSPLVVTIEAPPGIDGYLYLYQSGAAKSITYASVRGGTTSNYAPATFNQQLSSGSYSVTWERNDKQVLAETECQVVDRP
jgi:hypothetical protein